MIRHPAAEQIVETLARAGHVAVYAGGCVRDALLQRPYPDVDIATSATPDQVQALFPQASDPQGKAFGVIRIRLQEHVFEIATFRLDGPYLDGRRPSSITFTTAEEDAKRRDFTINGMFFDPLRNELLDFVQGRKDLAAKTVRAIGDPLARFTEDRLRLFRAIRFAVQLGFDIEPATWNSLLQLAPQSNVISPERVRDELIKIFTSADPARGFDLLHESGLTAVWLPELLEMRGCAQSPEHHPEGDVWVHTRLLLTHLKHPSPVLAFSALLHDVGKPRTSKTEPNGRIRFFGHEGVGARMAEEILRRLRFSNDDIHAITACIANHMAFKDAPQMRVSTLKRLLARPTFSEELELHRIDCSSSHGQLDIHAFLTAKLSELSQEEIKPKPLLTGHDLQQLGAQPGPEMGRILHQLMDEQLEGKFTDRAAALARAREIMR
ncbi:MAG: CCA tRNA nucleotidyltransferase [Verrucomicrobia bacterium]|nr:CCA tRNA nucleotidyltransferase [Pseudomonadota bacterium]NBS06410.1 CCA tRNA nucleotidyltransferase [Verrucomicrobiota bacterium]NBS78379.1 CCA tRNA nucleotidyltransferase [bacterium]NBS50463.1 CCA tRNA nucleotidyltransferase [Verrucomicrobiota bacterium]NBV96508.1 CCA tRNA nucleotidyltransferase [Verrucomicrobiota bacterium]